MKKNGFSIIELMIVLGILTVVATIAVPRVQVWSARNRGMQAIVEILSDFSKAKSIAGYTVVGDATNGKIDIPVNVAGGTGATMPVYLGIRLQTAMVFRAHEYLIYQKDTMTTGDWGSARMLKKNTLPDSVSIVKVNNFNEITSTSGANDVSRRLVFTSNGLIKGDEENVENPAHADKISCGGQMPPMTTLVFSAVVRSKISGSSDSVWFRVDVDQTGEYYMCMAFSAATSYNSSIFSSHGNPISM